MGFCHTMITHLSIVAIGYIREDPHNENKKTTYNDNMNTIQDPTCIQFFQEIANSFVCGLENFIQLLEEGCVVSQWVDCSKRVPKSTYYGTIWTRAVTFLIGLLNID